MLSYVLKELDILLKSFLAVLDRTKQPGAETVGWVEGIPVAPQLLKGTHGIQLLPANATAVLDVTPVSGVVVNQI